MHAQVWEWRSETYVLKQQGHYHDVGTTAFSPDGAQIVTGADDAKVTAERRTAQQTKVQLGQCVVELLCSLSNLRAILH